MNIDFDHKPFANIPTHIRSWFQDVTDRAEADPSFPISWVSLPSGSTEDDVIPVSESILALFPRCRDEGLAPVGKAFVL